MLEIIILAGAILLGLLTYWRETRSNKIFRTYNAFINKKDTRMEASDRKGFFYQRPLIYRALNALLLAILFGMLLYNIPLLELKIIELAVAFFVGFVGGTYIAAALPSVKRAVDNPLDALQEVGKAGRDIVSDLSEAASEKLMGEEKENDKPAPEDKSEETEEPKKETARERMKRKGYLK